MPLINIEYNKEKVSKNELLDLEVELQEIFVNLTKMPDVSVFTNSSESTYRADPVEIFVKLSEVKDLKKLIDDASIHIKNWKDRTGFKLPINLTIIPMEWEFRVGI